MNRTLVLMTFALASLAGGAFAGTVHEVLVGNDFFSPAQITVEPGDTVRWQLVAGFHTATSGPPCAPSGYFNGPVDPFNPVFEWVVPDDLDVDFIPYFCFPHCGHMHGSITIESGPKCAPADLNCDGAVDVQDLLILLSNWGSCPKKGDCQGDIDESGAVDVQDLLILLSNWG